MQLHTLDKNLPGSEQAMKAARSLIELLLKSTQTLDKLMKMQEALGIFPAKMIIQDVVTRWWSTWSMLNCLNELERPIQSLFAANDIDPKQNYLNLRKLYLEKLKKCYRCQITNIIYFSNAIFMYPSNKRSK